MDRAKKSSVVPSWLVYAAVVAVGCAPGGGSEGSGAKPQENSVSDAQTPVVAPVSPAAPASSAELIERYRSITERLSNEQALPPGEMADLRRQLEQIASEANDPHLRANASLAAGALFQESGDVRSAIAFFRQAVAAVPDEAPTHAMLGLALAKDGNFAAAIDVQQRVVELVPNDLEAWLHLGEMNVKAGREDAAAKAYGTYEVRRKAILDGLTLKSKTGEYLLGVDDRVAMAAALEVAADNGTGLALLYALKSDPSAGVRAEVARVMGTQRLVGYRKLLADVGATEVDADAKATITWALSEIDRDGRETQPGPAPIAAGHGAGLTATPSPVPTTPSGG